MLLILAPNPLSSSRPSPRLSISSWLLCETAFCRAQQHQWPHTVLSPGRVLSFPALDSTLQCPGAYRFDVLPSFPHPPTALVVRTCTALEWALLEEGPPSTCPIWSPSFCLDLCLVLTEVLVHSLWIALVVFTFLPRSLSPVQTTTIPSHCHLHHASPHPHNYFHDHPQVAARGVLLLTLLLLCG